jgi:TrbL/VirB6 plasmid conjugal transfer protein
VSNGITQTLNVAFAKLPAPVQSNCVPVQQTDPQAPTVASYNYTSGNGVVDTNANELWTVLVCKPWLDGEFGTTAYAAPGKQPKTIVNTYGRSLLWSQAIAANEKATPDVIQAKENAYAGIASSIKQNAPGVYPLFQGKQWTTRLEIAFAALFASLIAGVLVLLIAITLIVLKLGFLLLLVAGPFFLIVGTHPGFGRVIALRWAELLIGVLLKTAAVALVLSVLLYAYSLIMGTSDAALPWALKILMISLVTITVFIYRKPFAHLFSAVGYGVIGSRERADIHLERGTSGTVRNPLDAAGAAIPGFAAYRAARWARRNPAQAAGLAARMLAAAATGGVAAGAAEETPDGVPVSGQAAEDGASAGGAVGRGRGRAAAEATGATANGRTPPPLDLPPRRGEEGAPAPRSGWARGSTGAVGAGRARDSAGAPAANGAGRAAGTPAGNGWPQPAPRGNGTPRPAAPRGAAAAGSNDAARGSVAPRPNAAPRPAAAPRGSVAPRAGSGSGTAPASRASSAGTAAASRAPSAGAAPAAPARRSFWPGGASGTAERAARERPAQGRPAERRSAERPAPPPRPGNGSAPGPFASGGQPRPGGTSDRAEPPGPFWLRPLRRRK